MLAEPILAALRPTVVAADGVLSYNDAEAALLGALSGGRLDDLQLRMVLERALKDEPGALFRVADHVVDVESVAERMVLTHRITDEERTADQLDLTLDLGVFGVLSGTHGGLHLPDGRPLRRREPRVSRVRSDTRAIGVRIAGPEGWLTNYVPEQLVAARVGGGFLHLEALADDTAAPPPPTAGFDRLMAALGDAGPAPVAELLLLAAVEHPDWFAAPGRPFGELVELAGLETDGDLVGRPGGWQAFGESYNLMETQTRHRLPDDMTHTLMTALLAFDAWREERGTVLADPTITGRLHRHWFALFALNEELHRREADPRDVDGFAHALGHRVSDESQAVGLWLAARCAARQGQVSEARRLANAALAADRRFVPAIEEVAWYARDTGQIREALNLLQGSRKAEDGLVTTLQARAGLLTPPIGRNSPCMCGSGRKFKQCHLGRVELPERSRVQALLDKARDYIEAVAPPELLDLVLHAYCDDTDSAHFVALDLLLFDEGWMQRFLDGRRELLSDWDVATAERWQAEQVPSVFRSDEHDEHDEVWSLRDAADGTLRRVGHSPALDVAGLDRLMWCRLLPVGDRWYTSGVARPVQLSERRRFLDLRDDEPDPADRVAVMLGVRDTPTLHNTEGEPIVECEAIIDAGLAPGDVEGREKLEAVLDAVLEREDGVDSSWVLRRETTTMEQALISSVLLESLRLVTTASSIARHEELLALLEDHLGEMTIVADQRLPMARGLAATIEEDLAETALRVIGLTDDEDEDDDDLGDYLDDAYDEEDEDDEGPREESPELAAAKAQIDAHFAARRDLWLDQSIPVLDGHTPRQAAADEDLLPDLRTMLADMSARGQKGQTDAAYYRDQLGLTRD